MAAAVIAIDAAIAEIDRLRTVLKKNTGQKQVRSSDERGLAKATAITWFNKHRPHLSTLEIGTELDQIDRRYMSTLEASDRHSMRTNYLETLKSIRELLIALRSKCVPLLAAPKQHTADQPPDFSPLVLDVKMQTILGNRWKECVQCLHADAPLAATVMMGGLLEALLLARIHRESNKTHIFTCGSAPRDKSGKTKPLNEWVLKNYIEVSHDLQWITVSAKDVGETLRDYRNYIHPHKEFSHGINLTSDDAALLWEISKNISRQIIKS